MPITGPEDFDCTLLARDLQQFFATTLLPEGKTKTNALLKFLMDSNNRRGVRQIQDDAQNPATGVKRRIQLQTDGTVCFVLCKDAFDCGTSTVKRQVGPKQYEFVLGEDPYFPCDDGDPMEFKWDFNAFKALCVDQPGFFERTINQALMRIDEGINKEFFTLLSTELAAACNASGVPGAGINIPLFVNTTVSTVPQMNPTAKTVIERARMQAKATGKYAIFGGSNWWTYFTQMPMQDASELGYDTSMSPFSFDAYYDMDIDDIFGQNVFFAIPYGAMQLIQYNQNIGYGAINYPNSKKTVVKTPMGLNVDLDWNHNTAGGCNEITVQLRVWAELVVVPGGGCNLANCVNGMLLFNDCSTQIDVNCAPASQAIGSFISSPVFSQRAGETATMNRITIDGDNYSLADVPCVNVAAVEAVVRQVLTNNGVTFTGVQVTPMVLTDEDTYTMSINIFGSNTVLNSITITDGGGTLDLTNFTQI